MSLESMAVSAGGQLLKSALKEDGVLHEMAEKFANRMINKVGGKFGLSKNFHKQLDKATAGLPPQASPQAEASVKGTLVPGTVTLERMASYGQIDTEQALARFGAFDANGDGQVTREELTKGLEELSHTMANSQTGSTPADALKIQEAQQLYQLGQGILQNYDIVAGLDGNSAGVASGDLLELAGRDSHARRISLPDWQNLLA